MPQFRTTTGLVQLTFLAPPPADLSPGDRFMVKARISQPHGYATPGVFDYGKYLGHQSIWLTGLVDSPVDIMRLQTDNPDSWFKPSVSYRYLPERLRHRVATFLDQNLDNPVRGLYKAVLIGDQSEVPEEVLDNFKATGAMHVLAISGMHIGLLVLLFYAIFIRLLKRSTWLILHIPVPKVAAGLTLMPVTAYALIAGCNPPVLRALFMATVVLIAILFDRQKALLTNIALAALVLLVWQPTSLYTASFQLSFGAVIAIAIFFDNIVGRFLDRQQQSSAITRLPASVRKTVNWMLAGLLFSLAIMTAIAPLLVYHFNQIALIGPITTLLVEPLLCLWSLLIGLAAIVIQPLLPGLAVLLLHTGGFGVWGAEKICAVLSGIPFADIQLPTPSLLSMLLYYLLLGCILHWRHRVARFLASFCLGLLILIPAGRQAISYFAASATVSFLDIGQGSATLLALPRGTTVLIDGGGTSGERFDVGRQIIAPFLWSRGLSRLDGIIITHPHTDHYNGLPSVIKLFKPKKIWINGSTTGVDPSYKELLNQAKELGVEMIIPKSGDLLWQDGGDSLRCLLNPSDGGQAGSGEAVEKQAGLNNSSLVLKLESVGASFLFPGDIDKQTEARLLEEPEARSALRSNVLLTPHHGRKTSNSGAFLAAVAPDYLVVSSGRTTPESAFEPTLAEYSKKQGVEMLITSRAGAVFFTASAGKLTRRRFCTDY